MSDVFILIGIFLIACSSIVSFVLNKDIFSPAKIYNVYLVFFYFGIILKPVLWQTALFFLLNSLLGLFLSFFEGGYIKREKVLICHSRYKYLTIWLASLPGILIKVIFIAQAGGLIEYMNSLAFRVIDWAGKGHLVIWFYILPCLTILYFALIITDAKINKIKYFTFLLYFSIYISIGILTGSRSYIAITILGMIFSYSGLVKQVSYRSLVILFFIIIFISAFLGGFRNLFGNVGEFTNIEEISNDFKFENEQINYGLIPLELVFESEEKPLLYGETYLTIFTNFIPRVFFEKKPETGGIAFTKIYADDQWGGMSNLATGAVTEGVINFGYVLGPLVGFSLNIFMVFVGVVYYHRVTRRSGGFEVLVHRVLLFYILIAGARFSFSEFTDVIHSFLFYVFFPLLMICLFNRVNIFGNGYDNRY